MKNIVLIIGARPNFMKAFPVYEALKEDFNLTLIHTGQHFDEKMSKVFFEQLKFPYPDIHLTLDKRTKTGDFDDKLYINNEEYLKDKDQVIEDLTAYKGELGQMGEIRDKLKKEFEKIKPDLVMVFGDVTSTLAAGLASKMLNIDIAHVESGLRSGDIKMPEEVNRILTDHITKYYFVTEQSGVNNLKIGGITENVYLVGNTMIDTQKKYLQQALGTKYHETLCVKSKEYILITLHRPSNVDNMTKLREIFDDLEELSKTNKLIYPIHPRTKKNLKKLGYLEKVESNKNIILQDPLGYLEFTCLMANCKYVVTDSGGLQEETTALDIPCFTLRENTERPSTLIENNGTNQMISKISEVELKDCKGSMDLWDGKSSERILLYIWNIMKRKILMKFKSNRSHPLHFKLGHKIRCYEYCVKNNIEVPKMIYYGNFDELETKKLEKKSVVIKPHSGCSSRGINIVKYDKNINQYKEIFSNYIYKKFTDLLSILNKNFKGKSIFIEEYLETNMNGEYIPAIDYKVFCYNGVPKQLNIYSRSFNRKTYAKFYNLKTLKKIDNNDYFIKKGFGIQNNLLNICEDKLKSIINFSNELLNKINFKKGLISLDLYENDNNYLLGEFTLNPGALYYPLINQKYLKNIFN